MLTSKSDNQTILFNTFKWCVVESKNMCQIPRRTHG